MSVNNKMTSKPESIKIEILNFLGLFLFVTLVNYLHHGLEAFNLAKVIENTLLIITYLIAKAVFITLKNKIN